MIVKFNKEVNVLNQEEGDKKNMENLDIIESQLEGLSRGDRFSFIFTWNNALNAQRFLKIFENFKDYECLSINNKGEVTFGNDYGDKIIVDKDGEIKIGKNLPKEFEDYIEHRTKKTKKMLKKFNWD